MRLGRFFINADSDKELFWTDRKQGGRLYHFFNLGYYKMDHIQKGCGAISLTVPFVTIKLGWTPKKNANEKQNTPS
jgi:hypothetical protein